MHSNRRQLPLAANQKKKKITAILAAIPIALTEKEASLRNSELTNSGKYQN